MSIRELRNRPYQMDKLLASYERQMTPTAESVPEGFERRHYLIDDVEVEGIKSLQIRAFVNIDPKTGVGFFHDLGFESSTRIGSDREKRIYDVLDTKFQSYRCAPDLPECRYTVNARGLPERIERIRSQDLILLFEYTPQSRFDAVYEKMSMYQYEGQIIGAYEHGTDFVDENDDHYRKIRDITRYEIDHDFLYVVGTDGVFHSLVHRGERKGYTVFDPRVERTPVRFPTGTVFYDRHRRMYYRCDALWDEDGESLMLCSPEDGDTQKYIEMSDALEPFDEHTPFEVSHQGLYVHKEKKTVLSGVAEYPSYIEVSRACREPFRNSSPLKGMEPEMTQRIQKSQLIRLDDRIQYDLFSEEGKDIEELTLGKLLCQILHDNWAGVQEDLHFWVSVADKAFPYLEDACWDLYMTLGLHKDDMATFLVNLSEKAVASM